MGRAKPPFVVRAVMEQEDIIFRFLTRQPLPLLFLEDAMVRTIAAVLFRSLFPSTTHHSYGYVCAGGGCVTRPTRSSSCSTPSSARWTSTTSSSVRPTTTTTSHHPQSIHHDPHDQRHVMAGLRHSHGGGACACVCACMCVCACVRLVVHRLPAA